MKTKIIYRPLTATPFKCNSAYREIEPCCILQPYVRCYWGGENDCSDTGTDELSETVIPDTCVDIIYQIDNMGNIVTSDFIGINDRSFCVHSSEKDRHRISVFAIRFYAWSAYIFTEDSFAGTVNGQYDVRERFQWLDNELRRQLPELKNLADIVQMTENLLVKKLETGRHNESIDRVVNDILLHKGTLEISRLSKENFISSRQVERLFHEYIGISPKKLSSLVRYQFLWNDIVSQRDFDVMSAVDKYRYADLAHLTREFKRYHSMNIRTAREIALRNKLELQRG